MRRSRHIVLIAVTLALSAAPVAAADSKHGDGRAVVVPAGGQLTGQWFETFFEMTADESPFYDNGDPCVFFARNGKVLSAIVGGDGTVTCTAERGTVLSTGWDHFCSTFDEPPYNPAGKAEQRTCAFGLSQSVTTLTLTVDGITIDLLKRRFAVFSPQTTVDLPVGNIVGIDPGRHTLTSYGWEVLVRNLKVGRHVITLDVVDGDFSGSFEHIINIVPRT
jgi:hypothetical protein